VSRHLREPEHRYRDFLLGVMAPAVLIISGAAVAVAALLVAV
jgi:hypothetical protein